MISSYLYFESCSLTGSKVHLDPVLSAFVAQLCSIKCFGKFFLVLFSDFHFTFSKYLKDDSQSQHFKTDFFIG
jgi:hypothetical protein